MCHCLCRYLLYAHDPTTPIERMRMDNYFFMDLGLTVLHLICLWSHEVLHALKNVVLLEEALGCDIITIGILGGKLSLNSGLKPELTIPLLLKLLIHSYDWISHKSVNCRYRQNPFLYRQLWEPNKILFNLIIPFLDNRNLNLSWESWCVIGTCACISPLLLMVLTDTTTWDFTLIELKEARFVIEYWVLVVWVESLLLFHWFFSLRMVGIEFDRICGWQIGIWITWHKIIVGFSEQPFLRGRTGCSLTRFKCCSFIWILLLTHTQKQWLLR